MLEVQQLAVKFSQNSWDFYKLFKTVKIASYIGKLYHIIPTVAFIKTRRFNINN